MIGETLPLGPDGRQADRPDGVADTLPPIGPYRPKRVLGRGGMGVVYLADQTEPVQREVALKLVKLGMNSREVLARFEAERQALAVMNHSHIARVYDAGTTEQGRPYFVMEYVEGPSLTEFCEGRRLTTRARLELFLGVCDAVQHAHQKGVIHRDLKPSNILVAENGTAVPKVIDFGIAKATEASLADRTALTEEGQVLGTPEYMSPEQATPEPTDIDSRTDVYSLGVVLYRMLTGVLPFETERFQTGGLEEACRIIREETPPSPSTRLSSLGEASTRIATQQGTTAAGLAKTLRGDLDWITLKALEKDRTRRYDSASALAADLRRYLRREPVLAGPPSTSYRVRRFVSRHRGLVLGACAILLAVATGIAVSGGLYLELVAAQEEEEDEIAVAQAFIEFFEEVLSLDSPYMGAPDAQARYMLLDAAAGLEGRFADQPELLARLEHTVGAALRGVGLLHEARPHIEHAIDLRREHVGEDDLETLESRFELVQLHENLTAFESIEATAKALLPDLRRVLGEDHPRTLATRVMLAMAPTFIHREAGKKKADAYRYCMRELEEVRTRQFEAFPEGHPERWQAFVTQKWIGTYVRDDWEEPERALPLLEECVEGLATTLGERHPETIGAAVNLYFCLFKLKRYEEAFEVGERALRDGQEVIGPDHPVTLWMWADLASKKAKWALAKSDGQEIDEAYREQEEPLLEAFRRSLRHWGPENWSTSNAVIRVSGYYRRGGQPDKGVEIWKEYLDECRRLGVLGDWKGPDDIHRYINQFFRAHLRAAGRLPEGEPYTRALLDARLEALGEEHEHTVWAMLGLATHIEELERPAEAVAAYERALTAAEKVHGPDSNLVFLWKVRRNSALWTMGRKEEAVEQCRELHTESQKPGRPREWNSRAAMNLAERLVVLKEFEEAEELLLESLKVLEGIQKNAIEKRDARYEEVEGDRAAFLFHVRPFFEGQGGRGGWVGRVEGLLGQNRRQLVALYEDWGKPGEAARYRSTAEGE